MRQGFSARILPELGLAFMLCVAPISAVAADSSAWDSDIRSSVRLIGAASVRESQGVVLRAGVEIKLQPGWKTYWRYPGDSGVPPAFDFSTSENIKSVTVLWPAPLRFADGSGNAIGYKGSVTFPVRVVPSDPSKPVTLRLRLDYAVCETLCVPAKGNAELALTGAAGSQDAAVRSAEARVPRRSALGEGPAPAFRKIWRETSGGKERVFVELAVLDGVDVDLFAEGPSSDWALPLPEPLPGAGAGAKRFAFDLDGLPAGASAQGAAIRLTATTGSSAVETEFRLD